jgi:hypothetical protein
MTDTDGFHADNLKLRPPQPADTAPAPYLPGTVRGLAVYLQRMEMRLHHQLRRVDERIRRLEDRADELHLEPEYDPADAEPHSPGGLVDGLVANVARSLASAVDDAERAEAVEMLLGGWYAAWPASAVTDPHAPLAAELVRLLRPCTRDDLTDGLADALARLMRRNGGEGVTSPTWERWQALLAEHAARKG